ncbi:unnamed protein product [Ilex paraguariensis]|uniref:KIB1-4 beta-propeller domain-containing protein n=1 Tax=Ilex paraguariensis TaxID=185542 RepID=A0ABC8R5X4_9AQUA
MEMIVKRLTLTDRIRMISVCKPWRVLLMNQEIRKPVEIPWLMLPQRQLGNHVSFYNMNDERVYNLKLPEFAHRGWCCGSSKGWLVMITGSKFNLNLFLLNPITGAQLRLPSLLTIPSFKKFVDHQLPKFRTFINMIEISSVNAEECIVAIICNDCKALVLSRPGEKRWNIFHGDNQIYEDISFRNNVFDVSISGEESRAAICTIKLTDCEVILRLIPFLHMGYLDVTEIAISELEHLRVFEKIAAQKYLVESDSELLIVHRIKDYFALKDDYWNHHEDNPKLFRYSQTNGFQVYKNNPNKGHCDRLNNLGDHRVLLLANSNSLSLSGKEYNEIHGNCMYIASLYFPTFDGHDPIVCHESGAFYLEEGRIRRPIPSLQFGEEMLWFTPNL